MRIESALVLVLMTIEIYNFSTKYDGWKSTNPFRRVRRTKWPSWPFCGSVMLTRGEEEDKRLDPNWADEACDFRGQLTGWNPKNRAWKTRFTVAKTICVRGNRKTTGLRDWSCAMRWKPMHIKNSYVFSDVMSTKKDGCTCENLYFVFILTGQELGLLLRWWWGSSGGSYTSCMHACMHTYIHTYIHTSRYIHTYTYGCMPITNPNFLIG